MTVVVDGRWDDDSALEQHQPIVVWCNLTTSSTQSAPCEEEKIIKVQETNIKRNYIPKHVEDEINRYHFQCDARLALYSYLLKRIVPARVCGLKSWTCVELTTCGENGKPCLAGNDGPGVEFNLSHHSDIVAIAVQTHGIPIGIDVISTTIADSWNNSSSSWLQDFSDHALSSNEVTTITRAKPHLQPLLFFSIWSLKEAYLKAIGTGLTDNLNALDFTLPSSFCPQSQSFPHLLLSTSQNLLFSINSLPQTNWSFYTYLLTPHIVCSIASPDLQTKPPKFISLSPQFILDTITTT